MVGDVKEGSLDKEPAPTVYYVHAHLPAGGMVYVVRGNGDPMIFAGPVRQEFRSLDAALPVLEIRSMETILQIHTRGSNSAPCC